MKKQPPQNVIKSSFRKSGHQKHIVKSQIRGTWLFRTTDRHWRSQLMRFYNTQGPRLHRPFFVGWLNGKKNLLHFQNEDIGKKGTNHGVVSLNNS